MDKRKYEESTIQGQLYSRFKIKQREGSLRNIVEVFALYSHRSELSLVMEYFPSNLAQLARKYYKYTQVPFSPQVVSYIVKQVLLGIKSLHASGFAHFDIKPHNIVVNKEGEIKLCDLGSCRYVRGKRQMAIEGTEGFKSLRHKKCWFSQDFFQLGRTALYLQVTQYKWISSKGEEAKFDLTQVIRNQSLKLFIKKCTLEQVMCVDELLGHPLIDEAEKGKSEWIGICRDYLENK